MARWLCGACGSPWAPGAPCCPRCRSTNHIEDAEADVTLKINRQGVVTDSAAAAPEAIEHPADGTMSPPVVNDAPAVVEPAPVPDPAAAPVAPSVRTPPRRAAPPSVPRE